MIEQVDLSNPLDAKGRIKVELFEGGNKVTEVNSNNFISKGIKEIMRYTSKSLFTQSRLTGAKNISQDFSDLLQTICLTDADHPVDPDKEWALRGNLIGHAASTTTYTGTDNLRGNYNQSESSTNIKRVKMVFDFPTNAANGTVKSIYFRNTSTGYAVSSTGTRDYIFERPFRANLAAKFYKDKFYVLGVDATSVTASTYTSNKMKVYDKNFNLLNEYTLKQQFIDFEIYNDTFYFIRMHYYDFVHVAPLDDPTNSYTLIEGLQVSGILGFMGIIWHEEKQRFIVSGTTISSNSSGILTFAEFDKDFNLITTISSGTTTTTTSGRLRYSNGAMFVTTNLVQSTKYVSDSGMLSAFFSPDFLCAFDDKLLLYDGYIVRAIEIGSRCLLDTPITKNSNQTMKITYEFILE